MQKINRLHKALMDAAVNGGGWAADLMNTDDDSVNEFFAAAEAFACDSDVTQERGVRVTIIAALTANISMSHMSTYYACTTFIGTGTHSYRFKKYFQIFVRQDSKVKFIVGEVPEYKRRFTTTLMDCLVVNYDGMTNKRQGLVDRLLNLFGVWQGGFRQFLSPWTRQNTGLRSSMTSQNTTEIVP